jgi:hypothetical protein
VTSSNCVARHVLLKYNLAFNFDHKGPSLVSMIKIFSGSHLCTNMKPSLRTKTDSVPNEG